MGGCDPWDAENNGRFGTRMIEEWRDIPNFEGLYLISNLGHVKSVERYKRNNAGTQFVNERLRVLSPDKDGYLRVCLSKDGLHYVKSVHRLVAEAFIPNPDNLPVINHKNEDKQDNRAENLEWCTVQYNTMYGTGRIRTSVKQGKAVEQLDLNDNVIDTFYSMHLASRITGVPQPNIYKVCNGIRRTAGGYKWRYKDEY